MSFINSSIIKSKVEKFSFQVMSLHTKDEIRKAVDLEPEKMELTQALDFLETIKELSLAIDDHLLMRAMIPYRELVENAVHFLIQNCLAINKDVFNVLWNEWETLLSQGANISPMWHNYDGIRASILEKFLEKIQDLVIAEEKKR